MEWGGLGRHACRNVIAQLDNMSNLYDAFLFLHPALNVVLVHPEADFALNFSRGSMEGKCNFLDVRHCAEGFKRGKDKGWWQGDKTQPCPFMWPPYWLSEHGSIEVGWTKWVGRRTWWKNDGSSTVWRIVYYTILDNGVSVGVVKSWRCHFWRAMINETTLPNIEKVIE